MFDFLKSLGASSNFQKNRLLLTNKELSAPEESLMKKLLKTFQGDDPETRSQIAFATIVKKLQTSDSNDSWVYLLKNLFILDRVLEEMCFVEEIADLRLQVLDRYFESSPKYAQLHTTEILKNYWKLINSIAQLLKTRRSIFNFPRSQRTDFLATLSPKEILRQIQTLHHCNKLCFALIPALQPKQADDPAVAQAFTLLQKSDTIKYLKLQLLYKLVGYYSSQLLCVNRFVGVLAGDDKMRLVDVPALRAFKQSLVEFKANSGRIVQFINANKHIKGFETINYRDLDPMPGNDILKSVQKCISQRLTFDQNFHSVQHFTGSLELQLQLRPQQQQTQRLLELHSRKKIKAFRWGTTSSKDPFRNYKSSFSEDFPQKEIMTVDLILAIRKEEQERKLKSQQPASQQDIIYHQRQSCVIPNQEMPQHLHFTVPSPPELGARHSNLYSGLEPLWHDQ